MAIWWGHHRPFFPRRFATAIRQNLRKSCFPVHREYSTIVPSSLPILSSPGQSSTQRLPGRMIRNYATLVHNKRRISKVDVFAGNDKIRRFQSQNHDCKRVLIVGGGPTGLFLAHLLRSYNIPFRLIEAQTPEERFKHPQAHFLNTRTMEILKHGLSYTNTNTTNNSNRPNSTCTSIYEELRNSMPPVNEWMSFRFGPDMRCSNENGRIMAEVVHPVDRPLTAEFDANGRLMLENVTEDKQTNEMKSDSSGNSLPLSPESVGHLAQHRFCQILFDALPKLQAPEDIGDGESDILYGCKATGFDWNEETGRWTIKTNRKEVFDDVDIILAADGAASTVRKNLFTGNACDNDSTMLGTPNLQRLINVHFEIPNESTFCEAEMTNEPQRIPPAMLYTIFHPEVLAMVVRHGPGEYVVQIPYFEPYQTPEEDFSIHKVRKIVRSILGNNEDDFVIKSIRPWTMGSLVARNYYTDEGVFLVGDAAHIFPPAGGFGMNTGLQDAYSLAWRIALKRQQEQHQQGNEPKGNKETLSLSSPSTMGLLYEQERQPVARNNAALSVRNYRRVLNVMRACYLDDRHPALLMKALDSTASFVPLEMRRTTFRNMLQAALSPLSQLQTSPNGIYARTVKDNLRSLLGSGQGLPLLFPRHELDFSYDKSDRLNEEENEIDDWTQDSISSSPRLAPGMLFPHVVASVHAGQLRTFPRLQPINDDNESGRDLRIAPTDRESFRKVSTRDLAAQLSSDQTSWAFCLLEIVTSPEDDVDGEIDVNETLPAVKMTLEKRFHIPFLMSRLIVSRNVDGDGMHLDQSNREGSTNATICDLYVGRRQWEDLNLVSGFSRTSFYVVIRPDGHVAAISSEGSHAENLIPGIKTSLMAN